MLCVGFLRGLSRTMTTRHVCKPTLRTYAARATRETIASYDTVVTEFKAYKLSTPGI